jgi:hypothetical protein
MVSNILLLKAYDFVAMLQLKFGPFAVNSHLRLDNIENNILKYLIVKSI